MIENDYKYLKENLDEDDTYTRKHIDKIYNLLQKDDIPESEKENYRIIIKAYKKSLCYILLA